MYRVRHHKRWDANEALMGIESAPHLGVLCGIAWKQFVSTGQYLCKVNHMEIFPGNSEYSKAPI